MAVQHWTGTSLSGETAWTSSSWIYLGSVKNLDFGAGRFHWVMLCYLVWMKYFNPNPSTICFWVCILIVRCLFLRCRTKSKHICWLSWKQSSEPRTSLIWQSLDLFVLSILNSLSTVLLISLSTLYWLSPPQVISRFPASTTALTRGSDRQIPNLHWDDPQPGKHQPSTAKDWARQSSPKWRKLMEIVMRERREDNCIPLFRSTEEWAASLWYDLTFKWRVPFSHSTG